MQRLALVLALTILSISAEAQDTLDTNVKTNFFSIEFPGNPVFEVDTVRKSKPVLYHSYSLEEDSLSYFVVYRDRIKQDNKGETFQTEIDWLGYWTLAEVTERESGRLKGSPTLRFTATTFFDTYEFLYVLTKKHFIRIGVCIKDADVPPHAKQFIDSFELVK